TLAHQATSSVSDRSYPQILSLLFWLCVLERPHAKLAKCRSNWEKISGTRNRHAFSDKVLAQPVSVVDIKNCDRERHTLHDRDLFVGPVGADVERELAGRRRQPCETAGGDGRARVILLTSDHADTIRNALDTIRNALRISLRQRVQKSVKLKG